MTLVKLRRVPGWVKPFLHHVKNGKSEKIAANLANAGTADVRKLMERDPKFLADYQDAYDNQRGRPPGG